MLFLFFVLVAQGSLIVQVQAVDGDAGVSNEVFYEIISGKH